ncbi:MAG: glycoside hydrolase family 15 protein [Armatimonadetes bacterium]|nr:glycoside hydrolase family 15 protein [Armatimonadota bacterium]
MPRPLVYGNGRLLIAFDRRHRARDLFWPNIGYPNHLLGHMMRVGVWVDGQFSWCDGEDWEIDQRYAGDSLVGESVWRSWKQGLEIHVKEAVDPARPVFVRRFETTDLRGANRTVEFFFTQNLVLGQSDVGNTCFYHPFADAIVHYRGPYTVALGVRCGRKGTGQYATGIIGFSGLEGTWKDAEDGQLSGNPIAQGSVDSTFGITAKDAAPVEFALAVGGNLDEALSEFEAGWTDVFARAEHECTTWLQSLTTPQLRAPASGVEGLLSKSLLIVRTQIDETGAIIAANDADILATNRATYSYCWPRDGALTALMLHKVGASDFADRFAEFCGRISSSHRPCFLQKYRSDGCLGASWHPWILENEPTIPFQEDETALAVTAVMEACTDGARDVAWTNFAEKAAEFLVEHRDKDGLPLPSWDLWEERHGVHFWTACSVVRALRSIGDRLGESGAKFHAAADQTRSAMEERFFDSALQRYVRTIGDPTPDSSVLGGLLLVGEVPDERFKATLSSLAADLRVTSDVGGYARYSGDYYFRVTESQPGNPWVISTMWFARALAKTGDEAAAKTLLEWAVTHAEPSGVLAEQYHAITGEPLSVSPLTWSHAAFIEAASEVFAR